jgi:hypothetical protein
LKVSPEGFFAEAAFKYSWGRDLPINSSKAAATAYKIASSPASNLGPSGRGSAPSDLESISEDPNLSPGVGEPGHISGLSARDPQSEPFVKKMEKWMDGWIDGWMDLKPN